MSNLGAWCSADFQSTQRDVVGRNLLVISSDKITFSKQKQTKKD